MLTIYQTILQISQNKMVKVVLTGSIGNIGKPLTKLLVKGGHNVTVITSNADRVKDIEELGAAARVGSNEDTSFLAATFAGADVVYIMVPPKYSEPDNTAYYVRLSTAAATAIRTAGVKKAILLSSYGAHLPSGTGFILGSFHSEKILGEVEGLSLTVIRPGYFYYNLINFFKTMIQHAGFMGSNYGGSDKLHFVYTEDIAEAIAEEVVAPAQAGVKVRYVVSDIRTCDETAALLGPAIGKPELKWVTFTDEQAVQGMLQGGLPAPAAAQAADLGASLHSGALGSHYETLSDQQLGKVKLEDYIRNEFVAAFNA